MAANTNFSFSKGELDPDITGRVDTSLYKIAVKLLRNWIVQRFGTVQNRPGTQYLGRVKTSSSGAVRLIPFIFSQTVAFVLEFGNLYIRFYKNGSQVTEAAKNITAINLGTGFITSNAHGFSNGDEVVLASIGGTIQLNGRNVLVANKTANTFQVSDLDGTLISLTSYTTYTSGGTASRVYSLTTTYASADLFALNYAQSANVLTVVHPSYTPFDITRISDANWTITATAFAPAQLGVGGVSATAGAVGTNSYRYRITAISPTTGEESYPDQGGSATPSFETQITINNITQANPAVVTTATPHGYTIGDEIWITNVTGMTQVNNLRFNVGTVTGATTFQLAGVDSSAYSAYVNLGFTSRTYARVDAAAVGTSAAPVTVVFFNSLDTTVKLYRIYKELGGSYGLVGTYSASGVGGIAQSFTFKDIGLDPDLNQPPPSYVTLFASANNYPSQICYYQQRRCFANTNNAVATFWGSQAGLYNNFTFHFPPQSGDSVTFTIVGNNEVNPITGMLDCRRLVMFTSAGEWQAVGDASGFLSASNSPGVRQTSTYGSNGVRPLLVNAETLFMQAQSNLVRNLAYAFTTDNYEGKELSISAGHMIQGYTLTDWGFQKNRNQIVWMVRSDGTLLSMTYVKEQEVNGWAHHDFIGSCTPTAGTFPIVTSAGSVESVCCIPEGNETSVYLSIKRTLYGTTAIRHIERFSTRAFSDIRLANLMDAALTYNGTGSTSISMQFSGGVKYTYDEHLTLTASSAYFTALNVGDAFWVYTVPVTAAQPIQQVRFVVDNFIDSTHVQGHVLGEPIPASLVSGSSTNWARAVKAVTGLWHLKNQAVSCLADGYVVSNPLNTSYAVLTVDSNGTLTLDRYYAIITVGLPVTADVMTLDIDTPDSTKNLNQKMIVTSVAAFVRQTRGLYAGFQAPAADAYGSQDTSQTGLEKIKPRNEEGYDSPPDIADSKRTTLPIQGSWTNTGRVFLRVTDPLPATILEISALGQLPPRPQQQGG